MTACQVNRKQCRFFLDTGADVSELPQSLVAAHADSVGSITLKPFSKQNDIADLVMANIQVGRFDKRMKVAVAPDTIVDYPVIGDF